MKSLRTKMTLLTICIIILVVISMALISIVFIRTNEKQRSNQLLLLLCETGERNLDYYFDSVQKSVRRVAAYVESDLDGLEDEQLQGHMERVGNKFDEMASKTNGVLTYYYRIDPEVSDTVKGFWYTDLDGEGFKEHVVTDIRLYDTDDTSKLKMGAAEYDKFIGELKSYNKLVGDAVKEYSEKECNLSFEPISEDAFGKLMASNEWTMEQVTTLGSLIVE